MSAGLILRSDIANGRFFSRFLDVNGDGSGVKNANGNYLGAPTQFLIAPGPGQRFLITRLIVKITDAGNPDAGFYGNNITLVNGVTVVGQTVGFGINLTDPTPVQGPVFTNADWGRYSYDVQNLTFGAGVDSVLVRWTFSKAGAGFGPLGSPIQLDGNLGDFLAVNLNDNFTGLVDHTFTVQGVEFI